MSNSIYHYSKLHPGGSSLHSLENLKKYILLFLHSIDYLYQLSLIFQPTKIILFIKILPYVRFPLTIVQPPRS